MFHEIDYKTGDLLQVDARTETDHDLESTISNLQSEEKAEFLRFARRLLKWLPEERASAKDLLSDPFIEQEKLQKHLEHAATQ